LVCALWSSEDRRIHHNTEGATPSSAESEEKISILAGVGGSDRAVRGDDSILQLLGYHEQNQCAIIIKVEKRLTTRSTARPAEGEMEE